jgi:RNA polymerase sigma-70 factor (ECF subfamily)
MHVNVSSAGNPVAVCPPEAQLAELLPRVRQRDEAACRTVVELLYPLVSKVVHANLPRRDDPQDLIQEVFMKIFSRLDQFRGDAPFDHWVSRMAVTTCLDRLRRQRVRPELRWADLTEDEQHLLDNTPSTIATEDADAQNAFSLLEKLLAVLPQADAWLIRQVEIEQKSLAEVCALAGWNAGAARVRLFRARHRLRKAFRQLEKIAP